MRRSSRTAALAATVLVTAALAPSLATAQGEQGDSTARAPQRDLLLTPTKPLRFTTDEGTWMSLDVSPDGRTIVFDLLGDLYSLPVTGGKATRLTSGQAFDGQPHFAPDGKSIVFVSDRSGSDNLWLIAPDGGGLRPLTRETDHAFLSPTFTADGKYVVVSKAMSWSGSQYDLWTYYTGGGSGLRLTGSDSGGRGAAAGGRGGGAPNNFVGPATGPNPRYVYSAMRSGGGGYNQTSLGWQVGIFDRENGRTFIRTDAPGSGMRPALSPDGRWLTYATRIDSLTSLMLRDLASGDDRVLVTSIQRDDQESRFSRDLVPPYAFLPDSRSLVIAHHGHFWRVSVPDGRQQMIPFTADVDQMIAGAIKEDYPLDDSTLTVRQIRDQEPSPDGKRLVFGALDRLWVMDLPNGTPKRLVPAGDVGEFDPGWSPDGRYVVYVTWNDASGGDVFRTRADGSGQPEKLSPQSAFYAYPAYTPDGRRIVVNRGPRQMRAGRDELEAPNAQAVSVELEWMPADGGPLTDIAPVNAPVVPQFVTADTEHVYVALQGLERMRFDGTDQKTILRIGGGRGGGGGGGSSILISPDGARALVASNQHVYVIENIPETGNPPTINATSPGQSEVPVRKLTTVGGEFPSWTHDGRKVTYSLGHTLFTYDLDAAAAAARDSTARADSIARATGYNLTAGRGGRGGGGRGGRGGGGGAASDTSSAGGTSQRPIYEAAHQDITITVAKDRPSGTVVLRGARIITMKGDEVIAKGDILVRNNRIAAVGPSGRVTVPTGTKVIDVSGKTIIPGYVDIHAHIWPAFGVHRSQPYEYLANLAYGVTTTRDPQTSTTDVLSYGDQVETGEFIGPRIYATGPGVFSQANIRTLDDAREVLKRYSEYYHTNTIKQYMTGDRRVRQFVAMAAREQHLMPTLEGGLDFKKNLTEAMDGYSGSEHTLPIAPLYKDVVQLFAQTGGDTWTPTLIVQYGGPVGGELLVRTHQRARRPQAQSLHPALGGGREGIPAARVVGAHAMVVPALRRAGRQGRRRRRPRGTRQPRTAPRAGGAVGDLEHRVRRHASARRPEGRDDLRRRGHRLWQGTRVAGGREAR